ncbi:uncharacterized protein LOC106129599 [Amyelois transitella]|uniref:uncharacterized protein LOC106129599 n=1 Tax=Amyelois transitella TaxID=680683 RepID=UPI00067B1279|nr:uncharacterized protein LOC106129599 [Amyelois transitella]
MNTTDSVEQTSSKRQENGDAPTGPDRPLKKARFAWQVKGKHHLRNHVSEPSSSLTGDIQAAGPSSSPDVTSGHVIENAEQNMDILGDYSLKQDFYTLNSVIADTETPLLEAIPSIPTDNLPYPSYVSSTKKFYISEEYENDLGSIPMSMLYKYSCRENQCISRWQAKQMANGFVDNTINRILEAWASPPLNEPRVRALEAADYFNNLPGYNSVENEGILMAISAHGLQSASSSSDSSSDSDETEISENGYNKNMLMLNRNNSHPLSIPSDDNYQSPPQSPPSSKSFVRRLSEDKTAWPYPKEENSEDNELAELTLYNSSEQYCDGKNQSSPIREYNDSFTHFDFMDTAVSFAILNKGLTTFGND